MSARGGGGKRVATETRPENLLKYRTNSCKITLARPNAGYKENENGSKSI